MHPANNQTTRYRNSQTRSQKSACPKRPSGFLLATLLFLMPFLLFNSCDPLISVIDPVSGLSPDDGASISDLRPSFTWTAIEEAAAYEFQIATSQDGLTDAPVLTSLTAFCTLTEDLQDETQYFWRVRAIYGPVTSDWSAIHTLTTSSGTITSPISISTVAELQAITSMSGHYTLVADLDLTDLAWTPIGTVSLPFTGIFDGGDHTITGLNIDTVSDVQGLFGATGIDARIKNLALTSVNLKVKKEAGALVGINRGSIQNCSAAGTLAGTEFLGGLVGVNLGIITLSTSSVEVLSKVLLSSSTSPYMGYIGEIGGLVGSNQGGSISDCSTSGTVSGRSRTGGVVGANIFGSIDKCSATGKVTGEVWGVNLIGDYVGGVVGYNQGGSVLNSSFKATLESRGEYHGGLIGASYSQGFPITIENPEVVATLKTGTGYVGGLVGYFDGGTISDGVIRGNFEARSEYLGGAIGYMKSGTIMTTNTFSAQVRAWDSDYTGGLIGYADTGTEVRSCGTGGVVTDEVNHNYRLGNYAGGLIGYSDGAVTDCTSTVLVGYSGSGRENSTCGGLIGSTGVNSIIKNSSASGTVYARGGSGGLVGINQGLIERCWASGKVSTNLGGAGGLVYVNNPGATIRQSWAKGEVSAYSTAGGFVGGNAGTIEDCYATGGACKTSFITNTPGTLYCQEKLGGFIGHNIGTISRCYATGKVGNTVTSNSSGGFVGENTGTVTS